MASLATTGASHLHPHGSEPVLVEGVQTGIDDQTRALLLVHGRGASAQSILALGRELASAFEEGDVLLMAPQAAGATWYPGSFLEPLERNEPWLSSALGKIAGCSRQLEELGIPAERQILVGFSQGACLASEFVARNPHRYGGLIAFTGGVLGPLGESRDLEGDLMGTPILLSTGDPDPHVPLSRVQETAARFRTMGAAVEMQSYEGRPHTILPEEIQQAKRLLAETA